ncbi:MAG TPA: hypothetical protein VLA89_05610 [Gemmatimonadales bacterium]|nr:hypothetical protein [Gemmatimonadales bacterium]
MMTLKASIRAGRPDPAAYTLIAERLGLQDAARIMEQLQAMVRDEERRGIAKMARQMEEDALNLSAARLKNLTGTATSTRVDLLRPGPPLPNRDRDAALDMERMAALDMERMARIASEKKLAELEERLRKVTADRSDWVQAVSRRLSEGPEKPMPKTSELTDDDPPPLRTKRVWE